MYILTDNMIGGYYPFFMNNEQLGSAGYIYQLYSPSYNKTSLKPYISLTKVCDKTPVVEGKRVISRDTDILFYGIDKQYRESLKDESGVIDRSKINWVSQVRRAIDIKGVRVIPNIQKDGFPLVEITGNDLDIQKNLILNLRNNFRWRQYRIKAGNKIDILWTRNTFMVFDILDGEENTFDLIPCGLYKTNDIALSENLLPSDFEGKKTFPKKIFEFLSGVKSLESEFTEREE